MEMIDTDFSKATEITIFERIIGNIEDKITEENIGITGVMAMIEVGTDQEKGHSQELMVLIGIEVHVIVDHGQDLELMLIETEEDVIISESMIILQETVPPLEKK